jgi:formylglycine-generating enzyme required for sulfatase activity
MAYLDFELTIGPGTGREYPVAVRSPAGAVASTMHFPFDELALESRLKDVDIALLQSGGRRLKVPSQREQAVQAFGRALFETLLHGEPGGLYRASRDRAAAGEQGLRLRLRIEAPELAVLPWEFLYDPDRAEYLCLCSDTPLVRGLALPRPEPPARLARPLKVLGMCASPSDLEPLDVERERQRVEKALGELGAGTVALSWLEGHWSQLQEAMWTGPWHIFYFMGHGGFDRNADEGYIALADEYNETQRLTATQVGRLLADHPSLRLVVLNSCEGGRGSGQDIFSSTAAILLQRGVPAVLAMQHEISDRAAIAFTGTFFRALAAGLPLEGATTEARKAISVSVNNSVEWGTPVLWTRALEGPLFELEPAGVTPVVRVERPRDREEAGPEVLPRRQPFEPEMVRIPAGGFVMGTGRGPADERPRHTVDLPDYYLARTPVTNAQYAAFVAATGHLPPRHWGGGEPPADIHEHPVLQVSWDDALAYCRWLSQATGRQYTLPSEAEWEKGARGSGGRVYPWGNEWDPSRCNGRESGIGGTTRVGRHSPRGDSPYGLAAMAGNVWEWTRSLVRMYPYRPEDGREDESGSGARVTRGGSFMSSEWDARSAYRNSSFPDTRGDMVGFRVALHPRPGPAEAQAGEAED